MAESTEWALLAYRLPREPSTPRITLWRKLRKLGAVQLVDGLVALPATARNREQFDWLADEVVDADGEAWTWTATPGSKKQQRVLAARMAAAVAEEYRELVQDVERVASAGPVNRRAVDRLRRELHRIEGRDHSAPRERDRARLAVERLAATLEMAEDVR